MNLHKMECPYCGGSIKENLDGRTKIFCSYCGKQIIVEKGIDDITINNNVNINQNVNHRYTNDAELLKEQNRHKEHKWLLLLCCIAIAMGVCGCFWFMSQKNKTEPVSSNEQVMENLADTTKDQGEVNRNSQSSNSPNNVGNEQDSNLESDIKELVKSNNKSYGFPFNDHSQFERYWVDGTYRCPEDLPSGKYSILSLYAPYPNYEVSTSPNNMTWSQYALYREIDIKEGDYIKVSQEGILVPFNEIDKNNLQKYGIYKVGKDIQAGDYKVETVADFYESDVVHAIEGIKGGYQITKNSPEGEIISSNMIFSESEYITLNDGEYVTIVNATLKGTN